MNSTKKPARDALSAEPPDASAVPDGTRAADIPKSLSALIVPDSGGSENP